MGFTVHVYTAVLVTFSTVLLQRCRSYEREAEGKWGQEIAGLPCFSSSQLCSVADEHRTHYHTTCIFC